MRLLAGAMTVLLAFSCGGRHNTVERDPVKTTFEPFLIGMDFEQAVEAAGVDVDTTPADFMSGDILSSSVDPTGLPRILVKGDSRVLALLGSLAGQDAVVLHMTFEGSADTIFCVQHEDSDAVRETLSDVFGEPRVGKRIRAWVTLTYTISELGVGRAEPENAAVDRVCFDATKTDAIGRLPGDPRFEAAATTMADLRTLGTCIEAYAVDNGMYPVAENFAALKPLIKPQCSGEVMERDDWGNEIIVLSSSGCYLLVSPGRNGVFEDDYSSYRLPDVRHYRDCEDYITSRIPLSGRQGDYDSDIVYGVGRFLSWPPGIS